MMKIVATNIVASRLPERRLTATPTARANNDFNFPALSPVFSHNAGLVPIMFIISGLVQHSIRGDFKKKNTVYLKTVPK